MPGFFDKVLGKGTASRVQDIQYLGNMKEAGSIAKLIKYLGDENAEIRRAAAGALEQHWMSGDTKAIVALTKALGDTDTGVRQKAALGLGEFVSKSASVKECDQAKQAIIALIKRETDEGVIKSAVIGLTYIQDDSLIKPMSEAFIGKDKKAIVTAIDAINDLPPTEARLEMKKALRSVL